MKIDENHCKSRGGSRPKSLTIDGSDISAIDRVSGSIAPSAPPGGLLATRDALRASGLPADLAPEGLLGRPALAWMASGFGGESFLVVGLWLPGLSAPPSGLLATRGALRASGFQQIWRLRVCFGDRLLLGWPELGPFGGGSVAPWAQWAPPVGCLQRGVPCAPVGFCSAGLLCMRSRPAAHLVAVLWRSLGSLPSLHPRSLARLAARPGPRSASPTYRAPHDPEGVGGYQHAQTYTCDIPC